MMIINITWKLVEIIGNSVTKKITDTKKTGQYCTDIRLRGSVSVSSMGVRISLCSKPIYRPKFNEKINFLLSIVIEIYAFSVSIK